MYQGDLKFAFKMIDRWSTFVSQIYLNFKNPMELLGKEKYKPHPVLKIHLVKLMDFIEKN